MPCVRPKYGQELVCRVTVVVTGFEPYGGGGVNSSALVAELLNGRVVAGEGVNGVVLPVSFRRARAVVEELIEERPLLFLGLGLSPRSTSLKLEVVALNVAYSKRPDNDGYVARGEPIYPDGELALKTDLPIERLVKRLRREGVPVDVSFHAGTFLCNFVYYVALYRARRIGGVRAGFVHVPHATEYAVEKPQLPSLPLELMRRGVEALIEEVLRCAQSF